MPSMPVNRSEPTPGFQCSALTFVFLTSDSAADYFQPAATSVKSVFNLEIAEIVLLFLSGEHVISIESIRYCCYLSLKGKCFFRR